MSIKQIFLGFHQLLRVRAANIVRRPIAQFAGQHPLRDAFLHIHPEHSIPPLSARFTLFPKHLPGFIRSLLSLKPFVTEHVANYARRIATVLPGRTVTVAPLLGFIAAFLQESKTDEFKTQAACVAVQDDVHEFSKHSLENLKPHLDLSGFRRITDLEFGRPLGKGCNAAVYEARIKPDHGAVFRSLNYDLAVKVLFNYSDHSAAEDVSRLFENELLPSRLNHRNIIDVFQALVDEVPALPQSEKLFPSALPRRMNSEGVGRNQTMFVLMNKYSCTLRDDLLSRGKYEFDEGLSIFAQLLEGVAKLVKENIVHRDIKSDNILLSKSEEGEVVRAVISDFGCSLNSLRLNYTSSYISRGGNTALRAPEVKNAKPGFFSIIDYSRADLWSVGTIAYEIFTGYNLFFEGETVMDSGSYEESRLPKVIPENEPLNNLVYGILRRDPSKRPSPAVAATACYLLLWNFPLDGRVPSVEMVRCWIMQLCVKLICGSRNHLPHRPLLATFLKRCNFHEIMEAWKLVNSVAE